MKVDEQCGATVIRGSDNNEQSMVIGEFTATCFDANGNEKWSTKFPNVVTTEGKNKMLDEAIRATSPSGAPLGQWYIGLIDNTNYSAVAAGNTAEFINGLAPGNGWQEATAYSESNRPTPSFNAASGGAVSTSADVSFSINGSITVKGAFLVSNNTINANNAWDRLYSAGTFTGGDKVVSNGDTLNVSYTTTLT